MSTTIKLDQASVRRVQANLDALPKSMARRQFLIALNAAGAPAKATASSRAARQTGLLAKSMIVKIINNKQARFPVGVMIGPSRKVKKPFLGRKTLGVKKAAKLTAAGANVRMRRPSRYAHLAEKKSPAINAATRTLETAGVQRLHQKLEQGLTSEAARLPK